MDKDTVSTIIQLGAPTGMMLLTYLVPALFPFWLGLCILFLLTIKH